MNAEKFVKQFRICPIIIALTEVKTSPNFPFSPSKKVPMNHPGKKTDEPDNDLP